MTFLLWLLGAFSIVFALMGLGVLVAVFLPDKDNQESKEERARLIFSGFACLFMAISSGGYVIMRVIPPPKPPETQEVKTEPATPEPEVKVGDTVMYLANKRKKLQFEQINDTGTNLWWYSPVSDKTYIISKEQRKVIEVLEGKKK